MAVRFTEDAPATSGVRFTEDPVQETPPAPVSDYNETSVPSPTEMGLPPVPDAPIGDRIAAGVSGFADTVTMGLGDETAAGMRAVNDKFMDVTGLSPSDKSFTEMYQNRLGNQQDTRESYASQYPTEFGQGEIAGIGSQLLSPTGVTKAAATGANKLVKFADTLPNKLSKYAEDIVGAGPAGKFKKTQTAMADEISKIGKEVGDLPISLEVQQAMMRDRASNMSMAGGIVKRMLPRNIADATAQAIGHSVFPGAGVPAQAAVRKALESKATKAVKGVAYKALESKYGQWMLETAQRGGDAMTANLFIKQNQDPEFREMLRQAKKEAAENKQ